MNEEKKKNNKVIISNIIISIFIVIIMWLCVQEYKDLKIKNKEMELSEYSTQNVNLQNNNDTSENQTDIEEKQPEKEYPREEIITEYKGYAVAGKLEISKIGLETYILQQYSEGALKVCVTKFWGANANEIGNFCIAGHNYINKNMFQNLNQLEVGDTFFISDNKIGKVEYEIYDIYTVLPEDVSSLSQETNGKREVTLITCTKDVKRRIIVKAREYEE